MTRDTPTAPAKITEELAVLAPEVAKVLPPHISVDKYMRTVRTAIATEPRLIHADRRSLLIGAIKCALDGLIPDGKEAAFVVYRTKDRSSNRYIDKVQYMPMVAGILKKIHNSREIRDLVVIAVHQADEFAHWVDDAGEHINFRMNFEAADRGPLKAVFATAHTRESGKYTEVMTAAQIEEVRAVSRAKDDGPWVSWHEEMAKKTVIRRLSKRLPMSPELIRVIRADDPLNDVEARLSRTAPASIAVTGLDATRALLGITQGADESNEPSPPDVSAPDVAKAMESIAQSTSIPEIQSAWTDICAAYLDADQSIPVALEAAFGDRMETLKQAAESDR